MGSSLQNRDLKIKYKTAPHKVIHLKITYILL